MVKAHNATPLQIWPSPSVIAAAIGHIGRCAVRQMRVIANEYEGRPSYSLLPSSNPGPVTGRESDNCDVQIWPSLSDQQRPLVTTAGALCVKCDVIANGDEGLCVLAHRTDLLLAVANKLASHAIMIERAPAQYAYDSWRVRHDASL